MAALQEGNSSLFEFGRIREKEQNTPSIAAERAPETKSEKENEGKSSFKQYD